MFCSNKLRRLSGYEGGCRKIFSNHRVSRHDEEVVGGDDPKYAPDVPRAIFEAQGQSTRRLRIDDRFDDGCMFQNMPMDEMTQAMVPAYQKHLTKGDIDNLVAFYSSPTGAKLLREMPSMLAEAMQSMMPIMTKYMETVQQRLLKETDIMIAQSKKQSDAKTPATHN